MRTPVYTEVKFNLTDLDSLDLFIEENQIGLGPVYIDLSQQPKEQLEDTLSSLESCMRRQRKSAKLPYPTYIITEQINDHSFFHIEKSYFALPEHYDRKSKRLKTKEQILLNKIELVLMKLKNYDLNEIVDDLSSLRKPNRELMYLAHENFFYEFALAKIKRDGSSTMKKTTTTS